jgi:hypothetical protein
VFFPDRIHIGFAQLQKKHSLGLTDAMYGLGAGRSPTWPPIWTSTVWI